MKPADIDGTDAGQTALRSRRGRRAVALIALALIAVVVAGYSYLRPTLTSAGKAATPVVVWTRVEPLGDFITYSVANQSLAWALVAKIPTTSDLGRFWIFVTVDGAKHWRQQLAGESAFISVTIRSFQFLDPKNGYVAAGNPLQLFRTGDGGGHWIKVALPVPTAYQLTFSDPQHGWLVRETTIMPPDTSPIDHITNVYATGDGGVTWHQLPNPPIGANGLSFRGQLEGWAGGSGSDQAHVYATTDGGLTWRRHDLPAGGFATATSLGSRVILLPGTGVVAFLLANEEFDFTSFDGGSSWRQVAPRPTGVDYPGTIGFQDKFNWWAIDEGVLYKSPDAGQTWTQVTNQQAGVQFAVVVRVLDPKTAWERIQFVDRTGLAITFDGGLHWTRVLVPQPG